MKNPHSLPGFDGPLRVSPVNPRYFTDDSGRAIYLTGSHTWANLVEVKLAGGADFDYDGWLDFMEAHNHNFMRMWTWDHPQIAPWTEDIVYMDPMPHARTGPGLARDAKPKFDLDQFNQAYFDRLRSRVLQAAERGIYVSVMLFEGWCIKVAYPASDPWPYHPYNVENNINGVHGDPDGDGKADVYSLEVPEVVERQKAYIRQVIDTVNDLDNVLYEIINEMPDEERAVAWQHHMIDYIHAYERTKAKQHPVGMTAEGATQHNPDLFTSPAEWISPGRGPGSEYRYNPPDSAGQKVVITDTDHLWGHGGTYQWVWKSFLRGLNPIFMDPWGPVPGRTTRGFPGAVLNARDYVDWALIRTNMGHARRYAERMDLNSAVPHGEFASCDYCLAEPGRAYLVYVPDDAQVTVDLTAAQERLRVEWLCPRTGAITQGDAVAGGRRRHFVSPFGLDVVLYISAAEG